MNSYFLSIEIRFIKGVLNLDFILLDFTWNNET